MYTYKVYSSARCKDCLRAKYYYKGKSKLHKCVFHDRNIRLRDNACNEFKLRRGYYPERLQND